MTVEKEEREGVEVGVQVGAGGTDVATQVSPRFGHRTVDSSTSMTDVTSSIPPLPFFQLILYIQIVQTEW